MGKTFITQKLISSLQARKIKAFAMKPIETGFHKPTSDAMLHYSQALEVFPSLGFDDINLYSFSLASAPSVADRKKTISLDVIFEKISGLQNRVEVLVIEGAGGLFTPIRKDYFMLSFAQDLQRLFDSQMVLVCDDGLGMINRFVGSKFILDSLHVRSLFFVNIRNHDVFASVNFPFMKDYAFEVEIESLASQLLKGWGWI